MIILLMRFSSAEPFGVHLTFKNKLKNKQMKQMKNRYAVVERLRAKILPENRIFVKKNLAISAQVEALLKERNWSQKDLAKKLGKTESEVSRMLSGLHNLTLKSIAKLEAVLENDIIVTPLEACEKYRNTKYVTLKIYIPDFQPEDIASSDYTETNNIFFPTTFKKAVV